MNTPMTSNHQARLKQRGVSTVEFAITAMLLFTVLFGIFEFGRLFYLYNTIQEVTRRTAREAVVRWVDTASQNEAINLALFGGASLPASPEITANNLNIVYLNANLATPNPFPATTQDNIAACLSKTAGCIAFVQVSLVRAPGGITCDPPLNASACYAPMIGLFPFLSVPIPASTVTMPAESMGYTG